MNSQTENKTEYPSKNRFILIGSKGKRICGFVEDDDSITDADFPNCEKCNERKIWVKKGKKLKVLCNNCDNLQFEPTMREKIPEMIFG